MRVCVLCVDFAAQCPVKGFTGDQLVLAFSPVRQVSVRASLNTWGKENGGHVLMCVPCLHRNVIWYKRHSSCNDNSDRVCLRVVCVRYMSTVG